jgi:23S rRNA (cytidine1920-2'-O)/16S rRNA (cytidine1409-2'-O)-methyltransferase
VPEYDDIVRMRLDAALVKRGLAESRSEASRLIDAGHVTVSGAFADKSSRMVAPDEPITVVVEKKFVSRGGEKLSHALDAFGVDVQGRSVMDAGVSTGGFTDCVLQRGAQRVFAVDVGRNQLHERIKANPKVEWRDGVNVREIRSDDMPFACSLLVADLSFISLTKVLPSLMSVLSPEDSFTTPQMVLLVKPQFEAGRVEVSRGKGVITDPEIHAETIQTVQECVESLGGSVVGLVESPIKGAEGNTEFLMFVECRTSSVGCES